MKEDDVRFLPKAEDDLAALKAWVTARGSEATAGNYVSRIVDTCTGLAFAPERGTPRDDLQPGLRAIGFRRGVTIVYRIDVDAVVVAAVSYRGRDWEREFD